MRIITFNVNGFKSIHEKSKQGEKNGGCGFAMNVLNTLIREQKPDVLCLQEIRCQNTDLLETYRFAMPHIYANHSKAKKGYSGTAIFSKEKPLKIYRDFEKISTVAEQHQELDLFREGRLLTAEFPECFVVCVYTPNSKEKLARLDDRMLWDRYFLEYLTNLEAEKPVITCGDFNCAVDDIDIFEPKRHKQSAGFSDPERANFRTMKAAGYVDTFRQLKPTEVKYSYWSNFFKARENNRGWRIDYVLVSRALQDKIKDADVLNEYYGSDHCPVIAEIAFA